MGSAGIGQFGNCQNNGLGFPDNENQNFQDKIINLEDVATSSYYINYNSVPNPGKLITITFSNNRIAAQLTSMNEIIGNLPVQYNYLLKEIQH